MIKVLTIVKYLLENVSTIIELIRRNNKKIGADCGKERNQKNVITDVSDYIQVSVFKLFTQLISKFCGVSFATTFPFRLSPSPKNISLDKWAPFVCDSFLSPAPSILAPSNSSSSSSNKLFIWQLILLPLHSELLSALWFNALLVVSVVVLYKQWLGDDDDRLPLTGDADGDGVDAVALFDVVKHLVLKLLPMQTTMTFELLLFDCVDWVLSVL